MNLYIILGAACSDAEFLELLFKDPEEAARSLNLSLTDEELDQLNASVAAARSTGAKSAFEELRGKICPPHGVCPWVTRNPDCQDRRKSA